MAPKLGAGRGAGGLPQVDHAVHKRGDANRGPDQEHRAPAEQVGDHAGQRAAQHVAADDDGEPAGDGDLAPLETEHVTDQGEADGKDAARRYATDDAGEQQHREA
jgi:hypothetical protein